MKVGKNVKEEELWTLKEENERLAWEEELNGSPSNRAMPVHLTFETTMKCNMSCIMCQVYRSPEVASRSGVVNSMMPFELFERVARETFPTAKAMSPTVMGEPLLTPYFPKILGLLEEYSVKMNMVTNGMLLTKQMSEKIMPYLNKIKVSFDGASKSTYERIRRGSDYDKIVDNIRDFNTVRDVVEGEGRPVLIFQVTLMRENIEELPEIVELAKGLGADWVVGLHAYIFDRSFEDQSLLKHKNLADSVLREAESRGREVGIATHFPSPFDSTTREEVDAEPSFQYERPRRCKFLWQEVWISHRGDVTPCCVPDRPVMGNLREEDFGSIWNGPGYCEIRIRLNTENPFDCCRNCSMATQYEDGVGYDYDEKSFFLCQEEESQKH